MINKAVYAFYSKPFGSNIMGTTHWLFPFMEMFSIAYSSAKAKEFFGHTTLVTDEYGKKLIIDDLQIPFDEVIVELDNCEVKNRFWAAGKIYGYTKAIKDFGDGFVFLDNDAGWHDNPQLNGAPLKTQHVHHEEISVFGIKFRKLVDRLVSETPNEFPYDIYHEASKGVVKGCNCGMIAFNDKEVWELFSKYTFALQNSKFFDKIEKEAVAPLYRHFSYWNVVVEEILLYHCFKRVHPDKEPDVVWDFHGFDFPVGCPNPTKYFHLWGKKKDREHLKRFEKIAVDYLPKDLTSRIHKYFGREGCLR